MATYKTNVDSDQGRGYSEEKGLADERHPYPSLGQGITPYLGLRSHLSQVWINRWTVLLFLVLVRTLIAIAGLDHDLASAKTEALSACSSVESMGSAMASMPHYLSAGVNELTANGIEKAVRGLMSMLLLVITGVEEMIVFYINMLTSTYLCLITLVVSGSLHVALKVIEDAADFLNKTLKGISDDIGTGVDGFQNEFNKFTSALNSVPKFFGGGDDTIPKIDLSQEQKALTTLQLPGSLDEGLDKLNNSIPDFKQVQDFVDNVLRLPFEEVKKLVNGSLQYSFDRSVFPVPAKKQLTFCSSSDEIASFFGNLARLAAKARTAFITVLVILAIAVCVPMAMRDIRRWNKIKDRSVLIADKSLDPLDVVYIVSRPYTSSAGLRVSRPLGRESTRRQILTRWVIAYATSPPALLLIALGITGLISCLCQYILLKIVQGEIPALANQVGAFAEKVVGALTGASAEWATDTNSAIQKVNTDINGDIFGWVNTSVSAVNNTLDAFIGQTTELLNTTFGGTILYDPVVGLFDCLIGLKIASFEKGLTWVSDHAHVDFPLLPNDTFSLGAKSSLTGDIPGASFLADPGSATTDKVTNAVAKVTRHLADAIRTETIISACLLAVWLFVAVLGVCRAVWLILVRARMPPSTATLAQGALVEPTPGILTSEPQHMSEKRDTLAGPAPAYEARVEERGSKRWTWSDRRFGFGGKQSAS